MRYSLTTAALASLATGSIAGVVHNHGHHRHHAREAAPEPTDYTYSSGQCWGTYGCESATAAGAPAQTTAPTVATGAPVVKDAAVVPAASSSSSTTSASSSGSTDTSSDSTTSNANTATSFDLSDFLGTFGKMGVSIGDDTSICQEGKGLANEMHITNNSGDDFVWTCFGSGDQQFVTAHPVALAVPISQGKTQTISFAVSTGPQGPGCVPVFSNTAVSTTSGQFNETMLEATFSGSDATVDVSREVNMQGHSISVKTSTGCTSDMDTCVFKCKSPTGQPTSQWGPLYGHCLDQYKLNDCSGTGSNGGNDQSGGCYIGTGAMQVTVGGMATLVGIS